MRLLDAKTGILAIETSGRKGSLAFGHGKRIIAKRTLSGLMKHSAELFITLQSLLTLAGKKPENIEHLYITVGPGSFTGLRIAVTIAKMMSFANDTLIVPISTMDVIADYASRYIDDKNPQIKRIGTILDAKRKLFYVALFEKYADQWIKVVPDCLMTPADFVKRFAQEKEPIWLTGEGLLYYKELFRSENIYTMEEKYWYPSAERLYFIGRKLAQQGCFADAAALKPFYLRQPQTLEKSKRNKKTKKI